MMLYNTLFNLLFKLKEKHNYDLLFFIFFRLFTKLGLRALGHYVDQFVPRIEAFSSDEIFSDSDQAIIAAQAVEVNTYGKRKR